MNIKEIVLVTLLLTILTCCTTLEPPLISRNNVSWETPSNDSWGSMPAGNGDIGSNVWVTPDGTLHMYISKTDAFSENGRLLKVGKVSVLQHTENYSTGKPC